VFSRRGAPGCLTQPPPRSQGALCIPNPTERELATLQLKGHGVVKIGDLQDVLHAWCVKLGVEVVQQDVTPAQLEAMSKSGRYAAIIGADGAGGVTANQWLHLHRFHQEAISYGLTAVFNESDGDDNTARGGAGRLNTLLVDQKTAPSMFNVYF